MVSARLCYREGDNEVWYYSTPGQIDELLEVLDREKWETHLFMAIRDLRDEITKHMAITEDLTLQHKGSKKSAIELEEGEYMHNVLLSETILRF